jgi:hypothetical protein
MARTVTASVLIPPGQARRGDARIFLRYYAALDCSGSLLALSLDPAKGQSILIGNNGQGVNVVEGAWTAGKAVADRPAGAAGLGLQLVVESGANLGNDVSKGFSAYFDNIVVTATATANSSAATPTSTTAQSTSTSPASPVSIATAPSIPGRIDAESGSDIPWLAAASVFGVIVVGGTGGVLFSRRRRR